MGKQINFYMSEKIQSKFISLLKQNNFIYLDNNSKIIEQPSSKNVYGLYLYKQEYGPIFMHHNDIGNIDSIKSPVIQFAKTIIKEEQKRVVRGRLWISNQYNNEAGALIKKEELFLKDYKMLVRWIKKNVPYQEISKGEYLVKEYVSDEVKELVRLGFSLTL